MKPLPTLILCLLVTAAGLAGYHCLLTDEGSSEEIAGLRAEIAALREQKPSSTPVLRKLIGLEARIAKLEQRAGSGGSGMDVEKLREALKEVRAIQRAERTRVHVRRRLAMNNVSLPAADEPAVVEIISRYTGALLAVREEPAKGGPGTRYEGARQAHARMCEELRALLPAERAQQLIDLYPLPDAPKKPRVEDGD